MALRSSSNSGQRRSSSKGTNKRVASAASSSSSRSCTGAGAGPGISVVVRVRPPLPSEACEEHCARVEDGHRIVLNMAAPQGTSRSGTAEPRSRAGVGQRQQLASQVVSCEFDRVLDMTGAQEDVWKAVKPKVDQVLQGYNATIFTYGMTGSGKTYTMLGPKLMDSALIGQTHPSFEEVQHCRRSGLVPHVIQLLFEGCSAMEGDVDTPQMHITMSYLQIYQEKCYDLLQPAAAMQPLRLREERQGHQQVAYAEGLTEVAVPSAKACFQKLLYGFSNIAFRATALNEQSSRSHSILTLTLHQVVDATVGLVRQSRIQLVDLAGNERWDTSAAEMSRMHTRELTSINRSLHVLGACIQSLSKAQAAERRDSRPATTHVPYRDSALTMLLRDSLSGNSHIVLLCTICSCSIYQMQSLCTLRFADRAKRVKLQVKRNDVVDAALVLKQSQAELSYLRSVVAQMGEDTSTALQQQLNDVEARNQSLEAENKSLKQQLAKMTTDSSRNSSCSSWHYAAPERRRGRSAGPLALGSCTELGLWSAAAGTPGAVYHHRDDPPAKTIATRGRAQCVRRNSSAPACIFDAEINEHSPPPCANRTTPQLAPQQPQPPSAQQETHVPVHPTRPSREAPSRKFTRRSHSSVLASQLAAATRELRSTSGLCRSRSSSHAPPEQGLFDTSVASAEASASSNAGAEPPRCHALADQGLHSSILAPSETNALSNAAAEPQGCRAPADHGFPYDIIEPTEANASSAAAAELQGCCAPADHGVPYHPVERVEASTRSNSGMCPQGHGLTNVGSARRPRARASYDEWHCDADGCSRGCLDEELCRFHCALCQFDLCEPCYNRFAKQPLTGTAFSSRAVEPASRGVSASSAPNGERDQSLIFGLEEAERGITEAPSADAELVSTRLAPLAQGTEMFAAPSALQENTRAPVQHVRDNGTVPSTSTAASISSSSRGDLKAYGRHQVSLTSAPAMSSEPQHEQDDLIAVVTARAAAFSRDHRNTSARASRSASEGTYCSSLSSYAQPLSRRRSRGLSARKQTPRGPGISGAPRASESRHAPAMFHSGHHQSSPRRAGVAEPNVPVVAAGSSSSSVDELPRRRLQMPVAPVAAATRESSVMSASEHSAEVQRSSSDYSVLPSSPDGLQERPELLKYYRHRFNVPRQHSAPRRSSGTVDEPHLLTSWSKESLATVSARVASSDSTAPPTPDHAARNAGKQQFAMKAVAPLPIVATDGTAATISSACACADVASPTVRRQKAHAASPRRVRTIAEGHEQLPLVTPRPDRSASAPSAGRQSVSADRGLAMAPALSSVDGPFPAAASSRPPPAPMAPQRHVTGAMLSPVRPCESRAVGGQTEAFHDNAAASATTAKRLADLHGRFGLSNGGRSASPVSQGPASMCALLGDLDTRRELEVLERQRGKLESTCSQYNH